MHRKYLLSIMFRNGWMKGISRSQRVSFPEFIVINNSLYLERAPSGVPYRRSFKIWNQPPVPEIAYSQKKQTRPTFSNLFFSLWSASQAGLSLAQVRLLPETGARASQKTLILSLTYATLLLNPQCRECGLLTEN